MEYSAPAARRASGLAVLALVASVATWAPQAAAVQQHQSSATGGTGFNTASTKPYPSTLTTTYTVAGASLQIFANNVPLNTLGGPGSTMFTPNLPLTTPSVQLQTEGSGCNFPTNAALTVRCDRGTLQINFSRPVTNPILHFVGLGSQNTVTGSTTVITSGRTIHTLVAPPSGVTLSVLPGATNLRLVGTTEIDLNNTTYNGTNCTSVALPATQLAGCGSVRVNGTVSSLTFDVDLGGSRAGFNATTGNSVFSDGYLITATVDEDFGDAPASYDSGEAASHIVDGLRLGASIDADNTSVFNTAPAVSPSPNAVAAGADNNASAGDGADEDGLTTPLATLHTGLIGQAYTLTPSLSGGTAAGTVCGWVDFNRNGVFEQAEGVCNPVSAGAASTTLAWTVPIATTAGRSYVRLRATQGTQLSAATPTGRMDSGEVEDYMIEIKPAIQVVKQLNPTADPGRFDLSIGGSVFAAAAGHGGTTGFRTLYHNSASGAPDLTVAQNIATTAVTTTVAEAPAAGTTATYVSSYACVNGAGAAVASGTGTSVNLTLPASVTGAAANGRAQTITCTFTNRAAQARLTIAKRDDPSSVNTYTPGGSGTYVIEACNAAGADPAPGATITDALPNGVTLSAPWQCTGSGGATCSAGSGGSAGGNLVSLQAAAMPANGCLTIRVPVNFSPNPADYQ